MYIDAEIPILESFPKILSLYTCNAILLSSRQKVTTALEGEKREGKI